MGDRQTAIRISCDTRDTLPFSEIEEFQGNLKRRFKKEISKIITSVFKYGHVAIVISELGDDLIVFEQDGFKQDGAKIALRSRERLLGFLRKK